MASEKPHIDITKLPNETPLRTPPKGINFEPPPPALEAQVARQSIENSRAAERSMREPIQTPIPALAKLNVEMAQAKAQPALAAPTNGGFVNLAPPPAKVNSKLAQAAITLLHELSGLAPEWREKIHAMKAERGLDDAQVALALIANSLDSNQYMTLPADHPYFAEAFSPAGTSFKCIICDRANNRTYSGQPPVCADAERDCGRRFRSLPMNEQRELLEAAQ